jgi:hypothetical protein
LTQRPAWATHRLLPFRHESHGWWRRLTMKGGPRWSAARGFNMHKADEHRSGRGQHQKVTIDYAARAPRSQPWPPTKLARLTSPAAWTHLMEPGVSGMWSVRDIIAHVTTWEEEALKHLPSILEDRRPSRYSVTYGGIDAFNAQMTRPKGGLPLSEVFRQLDDVHQPSSI